MLRIWRLFVDEVPISRLPTIIFPSIYYECLELTTTDGSLTSPNAVTVINYKSKNIEIRPS